MISPLSESAPAKINLTLRVVGRRADGYHELESLVAFAGLADALTLRPGAGIGLDVAGPFAPPSGAAADNLVLKAAAALRAQAGAVTFGQFHLDKHIPVAAGIGGGSADAAAALRLLARANDIALDDARLTAAALATGADVPVCLRARACVMAGIGEILSPPLDLPELYAVMVNPGVAVATRDVFAAFSGARTDAPPLGDIPRGFEALMEYLAGHGNDLTAAAMACAPVIGDVLDALRALPGVRLARMSGSGAACFALFDTPEAAAVGLRHLRAGRQDWWAVATTLG